MTEDKSYLIVESKGERIYAGEGDIHEWEEKVKKTTNISPDKDDYFLIALELYTEGKSSSFEIKNRYATRTPVFGKFPYNDRVVDHKYVTQNAGSTLFLDATTINFLEQIVAAAKQSLSQSSQKHGV